MNRQEKIVVKKVSVVVPIGGKKKPITKSALVCAKTGKIIRFLAGDG